AEHGIDSRLAPQDRRCASGRLFGRGASDEIGGLERGGGLVLCGVSRRGQHRDRSIASGVPAKFGDFSRVFDRRDREATLICLVLAHRARLFVIGRLVCAGRAARVRMRSRGVPLLLLVGAFVAVARADDVTASSPQTTKVSYSDSVEHYRRGDDDLAFKELAALTDADIRIGLQRLLDDLRRMVITTMRDIRKAL